MKARDTKKSEILFSSNTIRLNIKQWIFVSVFCIVAIVSMPSLWTKFEKFSPGDDYRIPYQLSNDYWLYERYSRLACSKYKTVVVGDSVVWGHYVPKNQTLSHYLNELTGENNYANLGVDGMHPAAMEGLLRYYGCELKNKNVILHLNLLWLSSPLHDLQTEKEFHFNHPKLVSQFVTKIPCYKASISSRLAIALERPFTFPAWTSHLNVTYFQNLNMPAWTIDNPYENPLDVVDFNLPDSDTYQRAEASEAPANETSGNGFEWVQADTSLQWKFFRNCIRLLQKRGNKVLVLVGPFNENMLAGESRDAYIKLKGEVESWLQQNNLAYFAPPALPAELYNDASHPTADGYKLLAEELIKSKNLNW
jgi:hypothetical protein